MFFCHQCNQTITISITSTTDPLCPLCNLGFLEDYTDLNPNPILNLIFPISDPPVTSCLPFIPVMDLTNLDHELDAFDPVSFSHIHLKQLQSSGINVQSLSPFFPPSSTFGFLSLTLIKVTKMSK
ncbi:hypothetical protein DY000_02023592 [Brassica cretica]|uniref:RING-type E3 ubiquitin transferase n=1 Tax=Brassica cretica TaxID=69181 RepID=A0ABQ7E873_BRACR|nr:hypothetical protein DY000_02023592 [Brassica cretica]